MAGTESLKRAQEKLFVKVQPSYSKGLLDFGDASTMQWTTKNSNSRGVESAGA